MFRCFRWALACAILVAALTTGTTAQGANPPLWVKHIQNYDGGISNGVRARLAASELRVSGFVSAATATLQNVQMNADGDPPLPQNETSVAYKPSNPMIAVAAANDYVGDGDWIGSVGGIP